MNKGTLDCSIKELANMKKKGRLSMDLSIQRASNQWSNEQKSKLVHSLLAKYYIPSLCFYESLDTTGAKTITHYDVLDGKQRLTILLAFLNDEFKLAKGTPSFIDDKGTTITLEGKKFKDLEIDTQKDFETSKLNIVTLKELSKEERETMFYRLNDGTPLSSVQRDRAKLGEELSCFLNAILEKDFFKVCNMTKAQNRKEDLLLCLIQGIMLCDDSYDWDNLNASRISNYCVYLKDNFPIEFQVKIIDTIDFLGRVFSEDNVNNVMGATNVKKGKVVFLKKMNIPIVICEAMRLCEYKLDEKRVCIFMDDFYEPSSVSQVEYQKYCKDSSTSKAKVTGRMDCLKNGIDKNVFFELKDEDKVELTTILEAKDEIAKKGVSILPTDFVKNTGCVEPMYISKS